jgi:hypothetical protein
MADGKISRLERAEILAEAKEVLTVKEYEGLIATMDRLSPSEQSAALAKRSSSDRVIAASKQDNSEPSVLGRMLARVPYIDDMTAGPHPQVSKIGTGIPYAKPREIDLSAAKQMLAKAPRLSETYVDPPTAARPLPRITRVERPSASDRTPIKPVNARRYNPTVEKSPYSKYADQSISPLPLDAGAAEPDAVRQPTKVMEEMGSPDVRRRSAGLATPTSALLPDRGVPSANADYSQPVQPQGLEAEFLR